jgi:hypothetical protein
MKVRLTAFGVALGVGLASIGGCKSNTIDASNSNTTNNFAGGVVGVQGGIVTSADGKATVRIPQGALQQETNISITPVDASQTPALRDSASSYTPLTSIYAFEPHGLQFTSPVSVELQYAGGVRPSMLRAEPGGSWKPQGLAVLSGTTATVSTSTFSFFTVAEGTPISAGGPADAGGTGEQPGVDPCKGKAAATSGDNGSYSSIVGTFGGFDVASQTKSMFVLKQSDATMLIVFSDQAHVAANASTSTAVTSSKGLGVALQLGGTITPGTTYTFTNGFDGVGIGGKLDTVQPGTGICPSATIAGGTVASAGSTITVTSLTATTFSGSLSVTLGGATISGTFASLPVVPPTYVNGSSLCCVPPAP